MGVEGGKEVGHLGLAQGDELGPACVREMEMGGIWVLLREISWALCHMTAERRQGGVASAGLIGWHLTTYTRRQAGLYLPLKTVKTEAQQ